MFPWEAPVKPVAILGRYSVEETMAAKFKIGDQVEVPKMMPGVQEWWVGKPATVRAILEDGMYEVLFHDAQDFAFIEEGHLAPLDQSSNAPASGH
jgi:hypothetical protein